MAMSELKRQLLKHELAKAGFPDAEYKPVSGVILIDPKNERMPVINDAGEIRYGTEYDDIATNTVRPMVNRVNELFTAWENAPTMPFEEVSRFRKLAEHNNIVLAARDDSGKGYGMHFVTWQYNRDRTGVDLGHYGTDYETAKEDFTVRAGLIPETKLFTKEQAAEIQRAIAYRIENDGGLSFEAAEQLRSINARFMDGYALAERSTEAKDKSIVITSAVINGDIRIGDNIIVIPSDDYGNLVGQVTAIDKLGTPEHDTGNPGDDIHISFTAFHYPPWLQNDIAEYFNDLFEYDEYKIFGELPLDDVIIAPDAIISLAGISDERINDFITDYDEAQMFCDQILQDFDVTREDMSTHANHAETTPPDIAAAPTKTSIEDRLRTAQEKVDAQSMSDAPGFRDRNRNRSAIE